MTRGDVSQPEGKSWPCGLAVWNVPARRIGKVFWKLGVSGLILGVTLFLLGALTPPLHTDTTNAAPAPAGEDFGQYVVDHQDDLSPFFSKNAGTLLKQATPLIMGLVSTIMLFTMLIGWVVDVLLSRGYAYFFAPAFADFKRSMIYATGRLFLTFFYTLLVGLVIIFCLGLAHFGIVISVVMGLVMLVAFAAQLVWILYLYRTEIPVSTVFYLALLVSHFIIACLIAGPVVGTRATSLATNFIATVITPKLQAEVAATKQRLAAANIERDDASAKVSMVQEQIAAAAASQEQLRKEIEAKKNSDVYIFSQIARLRAQGDLATTRQQLTGFLTRFPTSPLYVPARAQLDQVESQLAVQDADRKQQEADAIRDAAQARADLLARAGKGEVTLSEMRQAIIGKTRAQVSDLLGLPAGTGSDRWDYRQQMIVNPLTNEKFGLTVYFNEGAVQSVDYNRSVGGGTP
jgi:uncharacterized membrane protein (DUF106 family)